MNGEGCPACAPTGFQPHLPGDYYVHEIINIETQDRLFYKGGIAGDWEKRLGELRRGLPEGMEYRYIEHITFEIGRKAQDLEIELKNKKKHPGIRAPKRKFPGGDELFLENPLDYARENELVDYDALVGFR